MTDKAVQIEKHRPTLLAWLALGGDCGPIRGEIGAFLQVGHGTQTESWNAVSTVCSFVNIVSLSLSFPLFVGLTWMKFIPVRFKINRFETEIFTQPFNSKLAHIIFIL